ncbi:MAG: ribbon-helix-helix domain-containing protein [Kiloniellales bacterium]|nr:ribbon-helix-helix domain-containing protein [Kiloniellales bacterium]
MTLTIKKRSVRIAGHRTSFSIEDAFWAELKRIAALDGLSVNGLIERIDADRQGNLSSAVRVYVLDRLRRESGAPAEGGGEA